MTEEEINKYINQIAFSSAEEFLEKYKNTGKLSSDILVWVFILLLWFQKKLKLLPAHSMKMQSSEMGMRRLSPEYNLKKLKKREGYRHYSYILTRTPKSSWKKTA
jgi:molecular chaperone HtpG